MAGSDEQVALGHTGALGVLAGMMNDAGLGEVLLQDVVGGGEGHANLELAVLVLQAGDVPPIIFSSNTVTSYERQGVSHQWQVNTLFNRLFSLSTKQI